MSLLGNWGAAGTSTCYLTIDRERKHVLAVNYWNSAVGVLPMTPSGALSDIEHVHKPPKSVVATSRDDHLKNRQLEPHAHALVLDPILGRVAYVPDLGLDVVRQMVYDQQTGSLTPAGEIATSDGTSSGRRL
jgi:6-phosphogluconolactonase (cycloisomerase 2 family)